MKICFYSPYVPKHFGGGERHFFDIATLVASKHDVFISIDKNESKNFAQIKKDYESFLNYSLEKINFITSPIPKGNFFQKLWWTKQFDYFYYATDGSLFFSLAKKNNLHIQIPFKVGKNSLIDRLKLKNWNIKNTNSIFTKRFIQNNWHTTIDFVHNPKVNLREFNSNKHKEKIILNVGRFFKQLHSKRQDVLVEVFRKMIDQYPDQLKDWKLIFIGNIEDKEYFHEVVEAASGLPIEFHNDVSRETLIEYFEKSKIYWHATGFDIDEKKEPEKVEHFGITTLEAMASGCIPIVLGKGGQVEILGNQLSELSWETKDECIIKTMQVINGNIDYNQYVSKVLDRATNFDESKFEEIVWQMF
ncbi:MAG: glycosyltransferase family 4 protein [Pseudomonadales bacterium]|nr:glycosyltransferase family 4 protein [Pseudomonadales bacterium]